MKIKNDYGENLRKNLALFISQKSKNKEEFAKLMGVNSGMISNWLTGRQEPSFRNICKLLEILDCTFEELIQD